MQRGKCHIQTKHVFKQTTQLSFSQFPGSGSQTVKGVKLTKLLPWASFLIISMLRSVNERENWLGTFLSEAQFAEIHLHWETKPVYSRLRRKRFPSPQTYPPPHFPLPPEKKGAERLLTIKNDRGLKKKEITQGK